MRSRPWVRRVLVLRVAIVAAILPGIAAIVPGIAAIIPGIAAIGPGSAEAASSTATPPTKGALYTDGQDNRYLLGGTWFYRADPGDTGLSQRFENETALSGWKPVRVPNAFNAGQYTTASMHGSIGWYRRDFVLPANAFDNYVPAADRRWIIRFDSVNYYATVWCNGHELGEHAGAYLPFEFDLGYLRAGVNRLVVRVDSIRTPTDFPAGPGGGWWNFGGILRSVYLRPVQRADIENVIVRPALRCPTCLSSARIEEQAFVRNPTGTSQTVSLTGTYGPLTLRFGTGTIAPGATWTPTASAVLSHPHLWSIDSPYLYRARLVLSDSEGRYLTGYTVLSGVRTIAVVGGHLELNGRQLHLRGVDVHELDQAQGAAIGEAQLHNEINWVNELGAKVIRSHYPLNEQTLEAADRDGILIWSEIPVYGTPAKEFGRTGWDNGALALLRHNILTNENHPSVFMWSIGNEFPTPATTGEAKYIALAAAEAKQLDPTRPVGMAITSWPGVACQSAYAPLDVIGQNDYFGWFDAGGGTDDDIDALGPYLDFLHNCYPDKALMVSEYGVEGSRPGPVDVRGTYAFQINWMEYQNSVFAAKSYLSGAIWFALQDFAARPGWSGGDPVPHPPYVEKGVVNLAGQKKQSFAVMARLYHSVQQIGPAGSAADTTSAAAAALPRVFGREL